MLDFILISLFFGAQPDYSKIVDFVSSTNDITKSVVSIILSIVIPYTVGFMLSKSGNFITKRVRERLGNPHHWLLDYSSSQKNGRFTGQRLPKSLVDYVQKIAPRVFGYELRDTQKPWLWFYQIRAYVIHKGGAASDLSSRALDLANFAEILLLPLPILFGTITYYIVSNVSFLIARIGIAACIMLLFFYLLLQRYRELSANSIKHTYRAFVVLASEELKQVEKTKNDSKTLIR